MQGPTLHRVRLVCIGWLLAITACQGAALREDPVAVIEQPIISGSRETGYKAVVAIAASNGDDGFGLCTGSVIGPYQILTANHCVFDEVAEKQLPATAFQVFIGDNLGDGPEPPLLVSDVRTTPGTDIQQAVFDGDDIAI